MKKDQVVVEAQQQVSIEARAHEWLDINQQLRILSADLKEARENTEWFEEYQASKDKVKELGEKINTTEEIALIRDKIEGLTERRDLVKVIIKEEMSRQQLTLFDVNDFENHQLILKSDVELKRKKEDNKPGEGGEDDE